MKTLEATAKRQVEEAYKTMAERARYRPHAPSDGFGNITVPERKLDLPAEIQSYLEEWEKEEDDGSFHLGTVSGDGRKALIFTVEAGTAITSVAYERAEKLLELALDEVKRVRAQRKADGLPEGF